MVVVEEVPAEYGSIASPQTQLPVMIRISRRSNGPVLVLLTRTTGRQDIGPGRCGGGMDGGSEGGEE